jgi:hypothetical protein
MIRIHILLLSLLIKSTVLFPLFYKRTAHNEQCAARNAAHVHTRESQQYRSAKKKLVEKTISWPKDKMQGRTCIFKDPAMQGAPLRSPRTYAWPRDGLHWAPSRHFSNVEI